MKEQKYFKSGYYICHKDNLESILQNGVKSRSEIESQFIGGTPIHDESVLARRDKIIAQTGKKLNEYVNLYFQPRNAMLYRLINNLGVQNLVILQLSPEIWQEQGVCFSDRNAATYDSNFYLDVNDLSNIDLNVFNQEYWTDSTDTKQKMMAEILYPKQIASEYIMTVYAHKKDADIERICQDFRKQFAIEPNMFFLPFFSAKNSQQYFPTKGRYVFFDHADFCY